jgi:hypothetical protein
MTKQELIDAIADAAGVTPSDIKVLKLDYVTGSLRIEIDNVDLNPDEDEDVNDDDADDLDESDEE